MTNPPPTVFAVETDSAWVVILAVSLVTLGAALGFRRLIRRPGGLASGILLTLPLCLPLVAAFAFAQAALPEFSVLRPVSPSLLERTSGLLHLLLLRDGTTNVVTPYALTGTAGRWIVLIGAVITGYMLVRRAIGTTLVHRLIRRSTEPDGERERLAREFLKRMTRLTGLGATVRLLILPDGASGAFAVGGRSPRVLISRDALEALDDDELEATIAHELAHIEAHDVPIVFFAGFLRDLVAWNPLAHLAYRRLHRDREMEADRRAAAITGRPLDVASGLLKMCELMRDSKRHRFALAFGQRRGPVSRRVSGLLALADGRSAGLPRADVLYGFAAVVVALLGLQVGASVADLKPDAFAIMFGSPQTGRAELWAPKTVRQHHGFSRGSHKVNVDRTGKAGATAEGRAFRYPEFTTALFSVKERNLPKWIRWMSRSIRRVPPASLRWEGRQDWNMIPIVTSGVGVRVYRLNF